MAVRGVTMLAAVTMLTLIAGCASSVAPIPIEAVAAERADTHEQAERARFDAFLAESAPRLIELDLPIPQFQGLVPRVDWGEAVSDCVGRFDSALSVSRLEGGFSVNYFGVVGETYERIRWSIESCTAQYGTTVSDDEAVESGTLESSWRYQDATQRIAPCLRGIGVPVPPALSLELFVDRLDGSRAWDAYAFVPSQGAALARAAALCPPSDTLLESLGRDTPG